MKRLTIITGLIAGLIFTLSTANQARAQKKIDHPDIVVGVDGLACPFCAYGLEKKLKKLYGVKNIYVSIDEGEAEIKLKKDVTLAKEKVEKAVKDAGFTLSSLKYADKAAKPEKASAGS